MIRGNDFSPMPSTGHRQALETQLEEQGLEAMLNKLRQIDPEAAQRSQNTPRRVLRALEVYLETGETITAHNLRTQAVPPRFTPLWIGLDFADRQQLYRRIDRRVELMVQQGLVEEIRALLDSGISPNSTAMQAIGYKEFVAALAGRGTVEEAVTQVQQSSRRYAKRQLTWFRRNPAVHWILRQENQDPDSILLSARQILEEYDK